jgi:hypothetical protein
MATITIENTPINKTYNHQDCIVIEKDKLTEGIQKIKESYYNKNDESY